MKGGREGGEIERERQAVQFQGWALAHQEPVPVRKDPLCRGGSHPAHGLCRNVCYLKSALPIHLRPPWTPPPLGVAVSQHSCGVGRPPGCGFSVSPTGPRISCCLPALLPLDGSQAPPGCRLLGDPVVLSVTARHTGQSLLRASPCPGPHYHWAACCWTR